MDHLLGGGRTPGLELFNVYFAQSPAPVDLRLDKGGLGLEWGRVVMHVSRACDQLGQDGAVIDRAINREVSQLHPHERACVQVDDVGADEV